MSCPLCKEKESEENFIAQFDGWFLNFNRYPYLPGHLLLLPDIENGMLYDCDIHTLSKLGPILATVQKVLIDCIEYESCNIRSNRLIREKKQEQVFQNTLIFI